MFNYSCSLNSVVAWAAWTLAIIAAILTVFVSPRLTAMTILLVSAAATLHVRGFVHAQGDREINAFELGREASGGVRPLR